LMESATQVSSFSSFSKSHVPGEKFRNIIACVPAAARPTFLHILL
jgi:hypothetical protein